MSNEYALYAGEPAAIAIAQDDGFDPGGIAGGAFRPAPRALTIAASRPPRPGQATSPPRPRQIETVSAEAVLRSFNTWAFKREQPTDPQLMARIISQSIALREPVRFVLYWGKGPRGRLGEPDISCLDYLASLGRRVQDVYEPGAAINLIFTDTHAQLNGHAPAGTAEYFAEVAQDASRRGFESCRLSELLQSAKAAAGPDTDDGDVPEDLLAKLCTTAAKWYRGGGTIEQGAATYYRMNMAEKRAVEFAFPHSIFVTFNGSDLRRLLPEGLPIFFMYSLRRGFSTKPWFLPAETMPCGAQSADRL
jgi:L-tyrosine isonitrile synthase